MSEALLADLQRRLNNMVRNGVVSAVQENPLRCQVSIGDLPSPWLRCVMPAAGGVNTSYVPRVGEAVQVHSESGDLRNGVVYFGLHNDDNPPSFSAANEHVTKYADGAVFSYNWETHIFSFTSADGVVGVTATPEGWFFKGPVMFEDETTHKKAVTMEETLDVTGNISTQGELSDKKGTLDRVREVYDTHTHNHGDSAGQTEKPNQGM